MRVREDVYRLKVEGRHPKGKTWLKAGLKRFPAEGFELVSFGLDRYDGSDISGINCRSGEGKELTKVQYLSTLSHFSYSCMCVVIERRRNM